MKTGPLITFSDLVTHTMNDGKFTFLFHLLDVCAIFQASSADGERGYSLVNNNKTRSRNKFEVYHLEMLICNKSYLADKFEVDLDYVYSFWRDGKNRQGQRIAHANNDNNKINTPITVPPTFTNNRTTFIKSVHILPHQCLD
jgi:hypothetical protein